MNFNQRVFKVFFLSLLSVYGFSARASELSVMTYNVQNLFDSVDDPLTHDEAYLPLSLKKSNQHQRLCKSANTKGRQWECLFLNWSPTVIEAKMKNLSKRILSVDGGKGPDILILAEIENKFIVEEFSKKYLSVAGYRVVHQNSKDTRGIETAILTRLKVVSQKYHEVTVDRSFLSRAKKYFGRKHFRSEPKELRGILEAELDFESKKVHVLSLHLPSQQSSFAEREVVLKALNQLATSIPANDLVVAGGDFNITPKEDQKYRIDSFLSDYWSAAHKESETPFKGTYYYAPKKEWSHFDRLLLRKDRQKKARWSWVTKSVKVVSDGESRPQSFDANSLKGQSDHWPLYARFFVF